MVIWEKYWDSLPELARLRLESLQKRGLPETSLESEIPTKISKFGEGYYYPPGTPAGAEARPVRLDNNQIVWIRPGGLIDEKFGHRRLKVFDKPSTSVDAIIAALTVSEASSIVPPKRVRNALPIMERINEEMTQGRFPDDSAEEAADALVKVLQDQQFEGATPNDVLPEVRHTLEYVKDLLKYYRPEFDDLPREEQITLTEHTCDRVNDLLEAVRKLTQFAEYGTPDGQINPAVKNAARDVRAAELKAVTGISYPKIAKILGIPPSSSEEIKNDHPTVRKMVVRGGNILERRFGKDGWRDWAEAAKEEADRFEKLPPEMKWLELTSSFNAELLDVPLNEAREHTNWFVRYKAEQLGVSFDEAARIIYHEQSKHHPRFKEELDSQ